MTFAARFCVSFMFLVALCSRASAELAAVAGLVVGKVNLPENVRLPPETEVQVALDDGRVLITYPTPDGKFSVPEVPAGVHTLSITTNRFLYPLVKLSVKATPTFSVSASLPELPRSPPIPYPIALSPVAVAEYFETKKPFNLVAFLKTPYGMMAGFMVFSLFILPKLKVDPEEYKRVMERRDEGTDAQVDRRE